jgi:hypothetical protein
LDRVDSRGRLRLLRGGNQCFVDLQLGLLCRNTLALAEEVLESFLLEALIVLLGQLLLDFCPLFFRGLWPAITVAGVPVPISVPAPVSVLGSIPGSSPVAVVATLFAKPIPIPVAVTVSVSIAASVPVSAALALSVPFLFALSLLLPLLLAPFAALFLSPFILLALLLPPLFPSSPLDLASLRLLPGFDLALELSLHFLDRPELGPNPLSLGPAGGRLGGVFLVRLGTANPFFFGGLVANLGAAQLANVSLDGAAVDEGADDLFCFLVDAAAVECAIDKGGSFPALEGQKLCWVALDFLLGDFEDGFGDLRFVVLSESAAMYVRERESNGRSSRHTLASNFSHTCLRIES